MTAERVLIVEDEENARSGLAELISAWGYRTETARDGLDAVDKILSFSPGVILTDYDMPRMDGLELLERIVSDGHDVPVVFLTGRGNVEVAVNAMKLGAYDFIGTLVGSSKKMQEVFRLIEQVAPSTASVLITGESGTGKEMVARTIHELSPRKNKPFVAINCAAIPETLIESEIFGHEKGAFTGALERRTGCFELAEGGTLLLDEIGEMPMPTQAKLLRVLEDHKIRRLGAKVETPVDVRVLAATNKVPEEAVATGALRNDLYYRLNVFNIHMPALREHKEDLPDLVTALLRDMSEKHGRDVRVVSEAVMNAFQNYSWPGNVRELRNVLERAVIIVEGSVVESRHLPLGFGQTTPRSSSTGDPSAVHLGVGTTVEEAERQLILKTLEATNNNKTKAAEILGISLKTLHNKLKEYGSASAASE
jgi:DNA-binding NtrC family response regulator